MPLIAERFTFDGLSCFIAGRGAPLLLVHSMNATGSAAEMRPLLQHWRSSRTVFAIDLPGFGSSDRSDRNYNARLMTDALHAMAQQIHSRCGAAPIDALALSTGCEFLARAASERRADWGRLALVSPTGLSGGKPRRGAPGSTRNLPWLHRLLSAPLWSEALYRSLTKPAVVRYLLERTWGSKAIDEEMWADAVLSARAPGARHAPLHFLSGDFFSADILSVYESMTQPVWASHGVRGDFTDYRAKVFLQGRPNWQFTVFDSGALPYFEQPQAFNEGLGGFLNDAPPRAPPGAQPAVAAAPQAAL